MYKSASRNAQRGYRGQRNDIRRRQEPRNRAPKTAPIRAAGEAIHNRTGPQGAEKAVARQEAKNAARKEKDQETAYSAANWLTNEFLIRLDPANHFVEIAGENRTIRMSQSSSPTSRRIIWQNVITVLSAAVLIGVEVFGAAFAGGWALASLAGLVEYSIYAQAIFFVGGVAVMIAFVRNGMRIEPFTTR